MKDPDAVLDQKERELLKARMDVAALERVVNLLAEPDDAVEALRMLQSGRMTAGADLRRTVTILENTVSVLRKEISNL